MLPDKEAALEIVLVSQLDETSTVDGTEVASFDFLDVFFGFFTTRVGGGEEVVLLSLDDESDVDEPEEGSSLPAVSLVKRGGGKDVSGGVFSVDCCLDAPSEFVSGAPKRSIKAVLICWRTISPRSLRIKERMSSLF